MELSDRRHVRPSDTLIIDQTPLADTVKMLYLFMWGVIYFVVSFLNTPVTVSKERDVL